MMFFIQLFVFMAWLFKDGVSGLFDDVHRDIANLLPDAQPAISTDRLLMEVIAKTNTTPTLIFVKKDFAP